MNKTTKRDQVLQAVWNLARGVGGCVPGPTALFSELRGEVSYSYIIMVMNAALAEGIVSTPWGDSCGYRVERKP